MKKTLLIASMLTTALVAAPLMANDHSENNDCERKQHSRSMKHHEFGLQGLGMGEKINRKEMLKREFSAEEIRTLVEARLLIKGNENLKVGKISDTKGGYTVAIVTQDNSLVKELELASNGMPKEMYQHIQKRMEKHKQKREES